MSGELGHRRVARVREGAEQSYVYRIRTSHVVPRYPFGARRWVREAGPASPAAPVRLSSTAPSHDGVVINRRPIVWGQLAIFRKIALSGMNPEKWAGSRGGGGPQCRTMTRYWPTSRYSNSGESKTAGSKNTW
ncbi:hypothetical protein GCM10027174_36200 [Salinifilum aidingensis]